MKLRLNISWLFIWITALLYSLMLGGNLYEQMIIVRYFDDNPPYSLQFWQDILNSGNFVFYELAPIIILASIISLVAVWKHKQVRWLMMATVVSLIINTILTFGLAWPYLQVLFFPLNEPVNEPVEVLREYIGKFSTLSVIRWIESFAGMICSIMALGLISEVRRNAGNRNISQRSAAKSPKVIPA